MNGWLTELLDETHDRSGFDCGNQSLNDYIQRYARQNARSNASRTYVALLPGDKQVRGFFCLSASSVAFERFPQSVTKRLPRYPVPAALIGQLAVDSAHKGKGLGSHLLMEALNRCHEHSQGLGIAAVIVSAIDDAARSFYLKYGFTAFEDNDRNLYISMNDVAKALK